jgi:hypothetical protein
MAVMERKREITSIGMDGEKRDLLYTTGENVNWYSLYGK